MIAERTGEWKRIIGIVGLVDNEVTAGKRAERRLPRNVARHRLLDVEQSCRDRRQRAVMVKPIDQRAQGYEVRILLVRIQRHAIVMRQPRQVPADTDQARDVVFDIAVELELEVARAGVLGCIRDAPLPLDLVVEADGVPDGDPLQSPAAGEELRDVLMA